MLEQFVYSFGGVWAVFYRQHWWYCVPRQHKHMYVLEYVQSRGNIKNKKQLFFIFPLDLLIPVCLLQYSEYLLLEYRYTGRYCNIEIYILLQQVAAIGIHGYGTRYAGSMLLTQYLLYSSRQHATYYCNTCHDVMYCNMCVSMLPGISNNMPYSISSNIAIPTTRQQVAGSMLLQYYGILWHIMAYMAYRLEYVHVCILLQCMLPRYTWTYQYCIKRTVHDMCVFYTHHACTDAWMCARCCIDISPNCPIWPNQQQHATRVCMCM